MPSPLLSSCANNNLFWHTGEVDDAERSSALGQVPVVLWFTGLSGAGKSAVASRVAKISQTSGLYTASLDGDNLRMGLNTDLGFSKEDRTENIRRAAEVARLMIDAGLIVLASFISPFARDRAMARSRLPPGKFLEIFVDAPLSVAEARDAKGLYAKARRGEIRGFTGVDAPYEVPCDPDLRLDSVAHTVDQLAAQVCNTLIERGYLDIKANQQLISSFPRVTRKNRP